MPAPNSAKRTVNIDWERLSRFETHPTRVGILERLALLGGRSLSAKELAFELKVSEGALRYHVKRLLDAGVLEVDFTRPVRAVEENFYCLAGYPKKRPGRTTQETA